jgi:hypothetical protein
MGSIANIKSKIIHQGDNDRYGSCEVCGLTSGTVYRGTVWIGRYEPDGVSNRLAIDVFGCLNCVEKHISLQILSIS